MGRLASVDIRKQNGMSGTENNSSARRKCNNLVIGAVLLAFVALVFSITVVKMMGGARMEAFDHTVRPSLEKTE